MSTVGRQTLPGRADAAVVGAGAAGLAAAAALVEADLQVVVLEARDRVGGRAHSLPVDGGAVDLGATWFWANEPRIRSLADRLGLDAFDQHLDGDALHDTGRRGSQRIDGNPIDAPASRITGGTQSLFDALAARLPAGTLRLGEPVDAISTGLDGVQVSAPGGLLHAQQLVLAVPPPLAVESIAFDPELPGGVRSLAERTAVWMGSVVKAVAVFDAPFWRARGLAGSAVSHLGPFREFHDHSGPDGTPAAIFGFAPAAALRSNEEAAVVSVFRDQLVRLFGTDAASPRSVHVKDWSGEKYTQPVDANNDTSSFGDPAFGRPVHGLIHWAATEIAASYTGHLEGALLAGHRAAEAVLGSRPATSASRTAARLRSRTPGPAPKDPSHG